MAVADVAGKGFSAALLTFMIHAFLRSQTIASSSSAYSASLANIASSLNRLLFASTSSASYVTFFYAQYDERTGRLSFVNAGHNPPFVLHANGTENGARKSNGSVMRLTAGGPVLGLFKDCPVEENSFELYPGDFLLAYTDGAIEAVNRTGEEFGEDRLLSLVRTKSHLPAMRARDEIFQSIEEWCAGTPGASLEEATRAIEQRTQHRYAVSDWRDMNRQLFSMLKIQQLVLFIVIGLIVFVSTFNIVSTLIMTVHEKRREVGILTSMGAGQRMITRVFLWYGTMVGFAGTATGVILGVVLCWIITRFNLVSFPPEIAEVYFVSSIPFVTRVSDVAIIAAFSIIVSFLATIVPSLRAARLNPIAALRHE